MHNCVKDRSGVRMPIVESTEGLENMMEQFIEHTNSQSVCERREFCSVLRYMYEYNNHQLVSFFRCSFPFFHWMQKFRKNRICWAFFISIFCFDLVFIGRSNAIVCLLLLWATAPFSKITDQLHMLPTAVCMSMICKRVVHKSIC